MKPSEKVVLDTLRKTTLAYLSESDYAQIEKAVEQKGILNLTGTASILVKSAVQKHEGGGHDQASHGSWANGGASGSGLSTQAGLPRGAGPTAPSTPEGWWKEERWLSGGYEIAGMTVSDAQGAAMSEMQQKYGTTQEKLFAPKGGDTSKSPATPLASPAGKTFSHPAQTRSLNEIANQIIADPNYKGNTRTYAQPYVAAMHMMNDIGEMYFADTGVSVVSYALANMGSWRGEVARTVKAELKAMLKSLDSPVSKATSVKTGDMVSWNSSGGTARGKVVRVISSGKINVPDSSFEIEGSEDDPAALIQLYRDGKPTETKVGHKVSTLKKKLK